MSADRHPETGAGVVVIGLGRFGGQVAWALTRLGQEVLAIDADINLVQRWSPQLTHVVQADSTDEAALRQLGVAEFRWAVVAIGTDVERSVLTVLALAELGVSDIWARATSDQHAKILSRVGAHHVIFPEAAMGDRVAHLITSGLLDYIDFGDDFALAKTRTPAGLVGRPLDPEGVRNRYGVTVVGVKKNGAPLTQTQPDLVIDKDCILVVEGSIDRVQRFATAG